MAYYSRKIRSTFKDAMTKLTSALTLHGFGIVSTIDLQDKFKSKLNIDFRPYTILGVCNPLLAYEAVSVESHVGTMLPCNILVQEHENGEIEVSAMDPFNFANLEFGNSSQLKVIAAEVGKLLSATIDSLDGTVVSDYAAHFPENTGTSS